MIQKISEKISYYGDYGKYILGKVVFEARIKGFDLAAEYLIQAQIKLKNGNGLALAKRYLEKVGGSLLMDSIKGVGSTFTFTLPLTLSGIIKFDDIEESEILASNRILMLDNIGETYELIRAFLKKDYEVVK